MLKCPVAPFILAFILGPLMEENLRRAMLLSNGSAHIFMSPISLTLLIGSVVLLALIVLPSFGRVRAHATEE